MKLRFQSFLMILTILGVTGFQLFWLKQNYDQEQKTLSIKTDFVFRDVILQQQASKLKLVSSPADSNFQKRIKPQLKINSGDSVTVMMRKQKEGVISTINVIRRHLNDSGIKRQMFITSDQTLGDRKLNIEEAAVLEDTIRSEENQLFHVIYGVDSLQDSLKLNDISAALKKRFTKENITIPFKVVKVDSAYKSEDLANVVTIGFAKPTTYFFKPGNTNPYLLKRIAVPILLSMLLLAITIVSFYLLYKNLVKQKKLTAIRSEFIGNITHELKTPIATVSVAIEAMKNFNALESPERTQEYLDISANELQRLSLLVDKVLSLSKFEKNEIEIKKESFDLIQLIREVMESMKLQFEKQHAVTSLQLTGTNFIIEADRRHISSVVYNLLDNALKYSIKDPRIVVEVIDQSQYLELRVTDNGIGIPAEYNRKIFDQFFRVPAGDTHNIKGYGLGLSYVNYIVRSHQGFIEVKSELNKGSTFIIKLPFKEADVIYYDNNRRVIKRHFKL